MTESTRAVFLSYASEDAGVARRICEALRAAGIEVWFDQSELRGGDAWDMSIRRQIRSCALFMPIISASAHAREEGYFRLEWKLAVDRSHLMAGTRAFLMPVVIDGTLQSDERIPERFRELQWSQLPGGNVPAAFVQRVQQLLAPEAPVAAAAPVATAASVAGATVGAVPPMVPARGPATAGRAPAGGRLAIAVAALAIGALAIGYFVRGRAPASGPTALPAAAVSTAPTAPVASRNPVSDKSIAVLPFVDMSEKRDQEYFSDGLSEELIDQLTHIPDLKVIARTSSFAFKGKNEDMRTIAAQLGVANLLEGSVRKAGTELRITAQLIRAADGVHLWSQTYERKLTDVFKLQDEIAGTVASALKTTLQGGAAAASDKTTSVEAHNLYLQGRFFAARVTVDDTNAAVGYYEKALRVDSSYAVAWAALASAYNWNAQYGNAPYVETTEKARAAAKTALRLDPRLSEPHNVLATILSSLDYDWAAARTEVDTALALEPRSPGSLGTAGGIAFALGEVDRALALSRDAIAIDPLRAGAFFGLGNELFAAGRLDEAMAALRSCAKLTPGQVKIHFALGQVALAQHHPEEARAFNADERAPWYRLTGLAIIEGAQGQRAAADAALAELIRNYGDTAAAQIAEVYAHRKDLDNAFKWLDRGLAQRDPGLRWLKVDPLYASIRGDARYPPLLKKIGLPPG